MSCGAIPIVTDVKENSDWVSTSLRTGYLFDPGDDFSLSRCMKEVINMSDANRQLISESARSLISEHSNAQTETIKFLNLVE